MIYALNLAKELFFGDKDTFCDWAMTLLATCCTTSTSVANSGGACPKTFFKIGFQQNVWNI